jgi:small subunit ribosomal protein S21
MTGVVVRPGESFEKALRRFTKTCEKSGILSDVKKNQRYEKPSEERKRKRNAAIRKGVKERLEQPN